MFWRIFLVVRGVFRQVFASGKWCHKYEAHNEKKNAVKHRPITTKASEAKPIAEMRNKIHPAKLM
jgi:hypothetical protein